MRLKGQTGQNMNALEYQANKLNFMQQTVGKISKCKMDYFPLNY